MELSSRFTLRVVVVITAAIAVTIAPQATADTQVKPSVRLELLHRAQVWVPTDIPSLHLATGPLVKGAFRPGETVTCDYVDRKMTGATPKFACAVAPDDEIKVKYGRENGEVYGEVAATRLLWALGFGADAMYSIKVICRGCPAKLGGVPNGTPQEFIFDPAAAERKMPGHEITSHERMGWSWDELDLVSEPAGGAPVAHRDALKLVAALLQHGDSKAEQQRLVCLDPMEDGKANGKHEKTNGKHEKKNGKNGQDEKSLESCKRPFMLINDAGNTFGRSNALNRAATGSVNFELWSRTPVWRDKTGCVANLSGSLSGTLEYPRISEEGRAFLAGLLAQLSDQQLLDLFETARFQLRPRAPHTKDTASATAAEWRDAFKQKRDEIAGRRCDVPAQTVR